MLSQEEENFILRMEVMEDDCFIDPTEKIEHPPVAISYREYSYKTKEGTEVYPTPIGTYGNFSFIQAPPKHKKTFLVSLLSAAYLGGQSKKFTGRLKGHRNDKCVIHFDTEQGRFHAQRVFRRALDMSGLDSECYRTYGLRSRTFQERIDFIDYKIKYSDNLGLVIIDGIADLVSDVNNIDEANAIVQKLMAWTEQKNIHIITVIHTNWGTNKPTGHLGSALEKKAETQIQIEKSELEQGLMNVRCRSSRNRAFDDFSFYVNTLGLPEIADQDINILDVIGGNKAKHTNEGSATPISQGYQTRQNLSA